MHAHSVSRSAAFALAAAVGLSACASLNSSKEKGAVIGAAGGAAIGGIIGNQTGSTARGAVVGAVIGGAAGAIIGHQMDQKAKEITASVPGATVTRVGEGLVVTFDSGILFDFNSDALKPAAKTNLDNLADNLASFGDSKLLLVGHTDSVGTDSYNQSLSERRALAVATYLTMKGVPSDRVAAAGRGESEPVQPNATEAGRAANRRVEVAVSAGDKMKAAAKAQAGPPPLN
jgi:outer membrane protein OmpA-like peptidoglycan-associated protein